MGSEDSGGPISEGYPFREFPSPTKQFHREWREILRGEGEDGDSAESRLREKKRCLMKRHIVHEQVKKLPQYVGLWLALTETVNDPEEVLVYMYSEELGVENITFYRAWTEHYLREREFILANQVLELAEAQLTGFKNSQSVALQAEGVAELREWLERQILRYLVEDFYCKEFYKSNVCWEESNEKNSHFGDEGITEDDFGELAGKTLKKRVSAVLERVYGLDEFQNASLGLKRKSKKNVTPRAEKRKKFSDLINTKQFNSLTVYIEREFRNVIPRSKLLAYEYEYLAKKHPCKSSAANLSQREPFFVTVENRQKQRLLKAQTKHFRRKKNGASAPSKNGMTKTRIEVITGDENKLEALDFLKTQPTNSTAMTLLSELTGNSFGQRRLFSLWEDSQTTKIKIIKPRPLEHSRGNLLRELPRSRTQEQLQDSDFE